MTTSGHLKNPVLLYNLLRHDIREAVDRQVILMEDLYYRGVLIVRAGSFLDEETIYKLINFGFKRVNILLPDKKDNRKTKEISTGEELSILELKKKYLAQQKCIIADKDGQQINDLISIVKASYIKESNIFAVNNSIPIKNMLEEKQPKYVFIDLNLYPNHGLKVIKEIKKFTNAKIFLTAMVDQSKTALVNKLRNEVESNNASLVLKPISSTEIRYLLFDSISNKDLRRFLAIRRYLKEKFKIA